MALWKKKKEEEEEVLCSGEGQGLASQLSVSPSLPAGLGLAEVCDRFRVGLRGIGIAGRACFVRAGAVHSHAVVSAKPQQLPRAPSLGQNLDSCRPAYSAQGGEHRQFGDTSPPSSSAMCLGRS